MPFKRAEARSPRLMVLISLARELETMCVESREKFLRGWCDVLREGMGLGRRVFGTVYTRFRICER